MNQRVLELARKTYGNNNQILVAIEELNELAAVLAKFPRYDTEQTARENLHVKVVDECADVLIVLEHVYAIFGLSPEELNRRIDQKVQRLEGWLKKSDKMSQTTLEREVPDEICDN